VLDVLHDCSKLMRALTTDSYRLAHPLTALDLCGDGRTASLLLLQPACCSVATGRLITPGRSHIWWRGT